MNRFTKILAVIVLTSSTISVMPGIAQASSVIKAKANHSWSPSSLTVSKGTKVVWKNPTGVTHTVTSTSSNWSKDTSLSAGSSTSFTFNKTGTFKFKCKIHAGMTGQVKVT